MKTILPGQSLDGGIVIASVILNDTDYEDVLWNVLLLMPTPGRHYRRVEVWGDSGEIILRQAHENIVPAVEDYSDNGGDY